MLLRKLSLLVLSETRRLAMQFGVHGKQFGNLRRRIEAHNLPKTKKLLKGIGSQRRKRGACGQHLSFGNRDGSLVVLGLIFASQGLCDGSNVE